MGLRFQGFRFRGFRGLGVWGLGFNVWGLGFWGLGLRAQSIQGLGHEGCGVYGSFSVPTLPTVSIVVPFWGYLIGPKAPVCISDGRPVLGVSK